MKKIITIALSLFSSAAFSQTFPVQNLTVNGNQTTAGTSSFTGQSTFTLSPTIPTPTAGDNSTKAVSSAFVAGRGPCANIMDFGGNNVGAANNDTALTSALASPSNQANYKCVYFPPGQFNFAAQAGFTFTAGYQTVTFRGSGQEATLLNWNGGAGLGFNLFAGTDSVHVEDMTVMTGSNNVGYGIVLTHQFASTSSAALSTIQRVTIRGNDGYFGTHYFQYGIDIIGVSGVNVDSIQAIGPGTPAGTGMVIGTDSVSVVPIVFNITNSSFNNWNIGFNYGNLVQGVQMSNMNFTNDNVGVNVAASLSGLDQLSIVNSQFNSLLNGFNILVASAMPNMLIANNLFLVNNNSSGIDVQNACSTTTITGNSFEPNTGSPSSVFGIIINGWTNAGTIISGNSFFDLTAGVALQSGSKNVNVQSNIYQANTSNVTNAGTGNTVGGGSP